MEKVAEYVGRDMDLTESLIRTDAGSFLLEGSGSGTGHFGQIYGGIPRRFALTEEQAHGWMFWRASDGDADDIDSTYTGPAVNGSIPPTGPADLPEITEGI